MKKLLILSTVTILAAIEVNAQLYVQGGVNLANITKTNDGQTEKNNILTTFNAGIMDRFGLSKIVDLETGLLLTGRGSKAETYFNGGTDYVKTKFNPLYIEVPLNVVVRVPVAMGSHLFFHAGPYIAIGVAGKSTFQSKAGPVLYNEVTETIKFSNDDPFTSQQDDAAYDKLKRFDFGMNLGGGLQFKHLILKANYGLGFSKINSTESNNTVNDKNKYRTVSFSVGIPIGH